MRVEFIVSPFIRNTENPFNYHEILITHFQDHPKSPYGQTMN